MSSIFDIHCIDHYASIVYDLEKSCKFHIDVLGFNFVKSFKLKTSENSDKEDTVSVVLEKLTNNRKEICSLNQPITDLSFLNSYLQKYGEGLHHIAYAVKNIEREFEKGLNNNIIFTSERIIYDKTNHLKQIFIDRSYAGYFIELIERDEDTTSSENFDLFSQDNIKELIINTTKNL